MNYLFYSTIILGSFLIACKSSNTDTPTTETKQYVDATYVKTVPISQLNETNTVTSLGIVMSKNDAKPSFKTGGVIDRTYVKEGDLVRKGQLLATLKLDEINAQVQQAEEALIKSERDMKRVQSLYQDSVATLEQFQNASSGYTVAKKSVEIARFNLSYSQVISPISGKVIKQIMHSGEVVGPGNPVYVIMGVDKQDWVINTGLIDRDWARVEKGDLVEIKMDAYPGQKFDGRVSNKSSVGGNTSGTFEVEISMVSQPKTLAAGLTSNLSIQTKKSESFTVIPIDALIKSNGNSAYVFTVVDGKARRIPIKLGKLLGDVVAVTSGLEGVNNVVTTGAIYLEDGDVVME